MQWVPWPCRSCTGWPTKLCVVKERPAKSGWPRSMPVSSTATLMPAPLRELCGTRQAARPQVDADRLGGEIELVRFRVDGLGEIRGDRLGRAAEAAEIVLRRAVGEDEGLGLDRLDRAVGRQLRFDAEAALLEDRPRDDGDVQFRQHQRIGANRGLEARRLAGKVPRIGGPQSERLKLLRALLHRPFLVGDDVAAGLEIGFVPFERREQHLVDRARRRRRLVGARGSRGSSHHGLVLPLRAAAGADRRPNALEAPGPRTTLRPIARGFPPSIRFGRWPMLRRESDKDVIFITRRHEIRRPRRSCRRGLPARSEQARDRRGRQRPASAAIPAGA